MKSTPVKKFPRIITKSRVGRAFREIGTSGLKQYAGIVQQEFLYMLQGKEGVRKYEEFSKNDDSAGAVLMAMEMIMRQITWSAETVSDSSEDQAARDYLKSAMVDMEHTWDDFVSDILSYLTYGWSLFEVVYKLRRGDSNDPRLDSEFDDGMIGWRKFGFRSQHSLDHWEFDDYGNVMGMWQEVENSMKPVYLDLSDCVLFRTKPAGGNPEGASILRNGFVSWYRKKYIEEIEAIGIERDLTGLPVLIPPEEYNWDDPDNADMLAWARELIANVRVDEYMGVLLPGPEWQLELLSAGTRGTTKQVNTNEVINRYKKGIAMSMLAQFIMLGMERVGSFALGRSMQDLWLTSCDGFAKGIADTINKHAVRKLFRMNPKFAGLKNRPRIKASKVNVPSLEELGALINNLYGAELLPVEDNELLEEILRISRLPTTPADRRVVSDRRMDDEERRARAGDREEQNSQEDESDDDDED